MCVCLENRTIFFFLFNKKNRRCYTAIEEKPNAKCVSAGGGERKRKKTHVGRSADGDGGGGGGEGNLENSARTADAHGWHCDSVIAFLPDFRKPARSGAAVDERVGGREGSARAGGSA